MIQKNGYNIGKPKDKKETREILRNLSDTHHYVVTSLALFNRHKKTFLTDSSRTKVYFSRLSEAEIEWYINTEEWRDAAGGYKIQGKAACLIKSIIGSPSNVVGLPIHLFYGMLKKLNYPLKG